MNMWLPWLASTAGMVFFAILWLNVQQELIAMQEECDRLKRLHENTE